MSKRLESKFKINRRLGVNLWGRAKSPVNKRDYGPGQHGQRRKSKPSGLQRPADGQAEAQGLLRQYRREAIPQVLRRGGPAAAATRRRT